MRNQKFTTRPRLGAPRIAGSLGWLVPFLWLLSVAHAAPVSHVLRIDPRTSVESGSPVITAVIDLSEASRIGSVISPCATLTGDEQLDCMSDALEKPGAVSTPHPFPGDKVSLSVRVDGKDIAATYLSHERFGDSLSQPRVGTAFLLVIDADARTGKSLDEAQAVATRFVETMAPSDLVNIVYVTDRQILADSKWLDTSHKKSALSAISEVKSTSRSTGRTRPLLTLLKQAAKDAFGSLGARDNGAGPPLHQAMVVLSTGYGGGDPSTTGPGAAQLAQFLTKGRLDEDNSAIPKLPVPMISIFMPPEKSMPEHRQLAQDFMENLANPDVGGFFTTLRDGRGDHAGRIVDAVRTRFADMIIARFRLACVAPTITQSFSLLFPGATPAIVGDSSFKDVPVGFDPKEWPLDLDVELTRKHAASAQGVFPGGTLKVFGNFCWSGQLDRPEAYFLPPGERLPHDLSSSPEQAREVRKRLTSLDMRAHATSASDSFAEFQVPDSAQILHGEGETQVVRLVIVDSQMGRTSGLTETTVLQLKGQRRPVPKIWYIGAGGVALLFLLLIALFFRGSRGRPASATLTPRPLPPESPYVTPGPVTRKPKNESRAGTRATIESSSGRFTVLAGHDLRVGRDGARCAAVIPEPKVSGLHATFRFEQGKLLVRDEGSTSGTLVDGQKAPAGTWMDVRDGSEIYLGPERILVSMGRG